MPKTKSSCTRLYLCVLIYLFAGLGFAQDSPHSHLIPENDAFKRLNILFSKSLPKTMEERLEYFSRVFLGQAYVLSALGEGKHGTYDSSPLYRFDGFDCETYVDTVLALAISDSPDAFSHCINRIRYKNGVVDFVSRNHFISLDWNPNNQNQGFVKDITKMLHDQHGKPVFKIAKAIINKRAWYQKLPKSRLKLQTNDFTLSAKKLQSLRQEGLRFKPQMASLPYIPLTALFNRHGTPNLKLFQQIPNGAVIEIVRPNWDLTEAIGTHLNVSHLGFVFWQGNRMVFRQASSVLHKTVDVDFIAYLKNYLDSPTIKGINLQVLVPKTPMSGTCRPLK